MMIASNIELASLPAPISSPSSPSPPTEALICFSPAPVLVLRTPWLPSSPNNTRVRLRHTSSTVHLTVFSSPRSKEPRSRRWNSRLSPALWLRQPRHPSSHLPLQQRWKVVRLCPSERVRIASCLPAYPFDLSFCSLRFSVRIFQAEGAKLLQELSIPNIIELQFSPRGTYLSTWERPGRY